MTDEKPETEFNEGGVIRPQPDTVNEYVVITGANLPNHTASLKGLGKFVMLGRQDFPPIRTRQAAYRLATYLILMAQIHDLPDEPGAHSFDEVRDAIEHA